MTQPPITGLDEWYPEHDTSDIVSDDMEGEIFRVVDEYGRLDGKNKYYTTLKGAKAFLSGRYSGSKSRIQRGKVTWDELD